ncbi:creatininase family protein [Halodesulfurarchaeum sp. HSR-GB]|uniref:creatininase family protein n=1 Tax=Halodesulfurarchaeum sp. HSR-GB TaxID=3074077 RepID=UPI002854830B|nr:creatininase family protein [Halodesulfurarchaeum sp. HSR-GB]MDR5655941.1 creatininase family protein [Halodesulfurarchaeum sp. HSR-GB]
MRSVKMNELAWTSIEEVAGQEVHTVIIPIGATEQHGPHLPVGTDSMIGEEISTRVANRLGDTLVAPPIQVGCSPSHTDYPGTISISSDVLKGLIDDYLDSLDGHGFQFAVLLPSHGGNFPPVETAAAELAPKYSELSLIPIVDLNRFTELINQGLEEAGLEYQEPVIHGGGTETAMMMAIEPSRVRNSELRPGNEGLKSRSAVLNLGFQSVTDAGVLGDPTVATPEVGEHIITSLVDGYTAMIEHERTRLRNC